MTTRTAQDIFDSFAERLGWDFEWLAPRRNEAKNETVANAE